MARPESFTKSIQLRVDQEFLDCIDAWLEERGHNWSRSEAIRTLVSMGMKSGTAPGEHINETIQNYHRFVDSMESTWSSEALKGDFMKKLSYSLSELDSLASHINQTVEDRQSVLKNLTEMRSSIIKLLEKTIDGNEVPDTNARKFAQKPPTH